MQSARRTIGVPASALVLECLDQLDEWSEVEALATRVSVPVAALDVLLEGLHAHDLIEVDGADVPAAELGAGPWAVWSPTAELFHRATRDIAVGRGTSAAVDAPRPAPTLAPRGASHLRLPAPHLGDTSLRAALRDRRTHRRFGAGPIPIEALATLLGLTFGVQAWAAAEEGPLALKTSPSGGARHSLEAYVWVRDVDGVPAALYHYRPGEHVLTPPRGRPRPCTGDRMVTHTARIRRRRGARRSLVGAGARGLAVSQRQGLSGRTAGGGTSGADVLSCRHGPGSRAVLHRGAR